MDRADLFTHIFNGSRGGRGRCWGGSVKETGFRVARVNYVSHNNETHERKSPYSVTYKGLDFDLAWSRYGIIVRQGYLRWRVSTPADDPIIIPMNQEIQNGRVFFFTEPELDIWQFELPTKPTTVDVITPVRGPVKLQDFARRCGYGDNVPLDPQDVLFVSPTGEMIITWLQNFNGDAMFRTKQEAKPLSDSQMDYLSSGCRTNSPRLFCTGNAGVLVEEWNAYTGMRIRTFNLDEMAWMVRIDTGMIGVRTQHIVHHPCNDIFTFYLKEQRVLTLEVKDNGFVTIDPATKGSVVPWSSPLSKRRNSVCERQFS